jgi:DNA modification methylase
MRMSATTAQVPATTCWISNGHADSGTAARFFPSLGFGDDDLRFWYGGKAGADDRLASKHPTVKPVALMRWLVRLITPPGGTILDPFAGTGTTGAAAIREGFDAVLIEREPEYVADIRAPSGAHLRRRQRSRHAAVRRSR